MTPLNEISEISGECKASNNAKPDLNDAQIKAYHDTVATLAEATTLAYEKHNIPLVLFSDSSDTHVGAVLKKEGNNGEMRSLSKQARHTFYICSAVYTCREVNLLFLI